MLKKVVIIYDDSIEPGKSVQSITGGRTFGNTIFKRKTILKRMSELLQDYAFVEDIICYEKGQDKEALFEKLSGFSEDTTIVHLFSNYGIKNLEEFSVLLEKACFVNNNIFVTVEERPAMCFFPAVSKYRAIFQGKDTILHSTFPDKNQTYDTLATNCLVDLGNINQFLQFITGGFDARFFNTLEGDDYTVTKKSTNKEKIKREYTFYHLLPDQMKFWFVMPFDYQENEHFASYQMERYHMTDVAIRWIHQAIDLEEFADLLNRLFYFIRSRNQKAVTKEEYKKIADELYLKKVEERIADLEKSTYYASFEAFLSKGTKYRSITAVVDRYKKIYTDIVSKQDLEAKVVIGHGDLCFSNILYHKDTKTLKLIDPKGALNESDLWTDPYYDLAKLSHSICGRYDFFNSGLYDIKIEADLKLDLKVEFDNTQQIAIFKKCLQENGFDYRLVRLYEASLFLSMLPLHLDNPQKVFAFLLNAVNILDEVEHV